jgi:hypothetical protein
LRDCDADYKVVRVDCPPTHDRPVFCLGCGAPLPNREGNFFQKYFRVSGTRRDDRSGAFGE